MEVEDDRYFGLCKCCLQDGCFRGMWVNYLEDGVVKNYGEMLNECFGLCWQKPGNEHLDQICDECIQQTTNTYQFRLKVLSSQNRLAGMTLDVPIKTELSEDVSPHEQDIDTEGYMAISCDIKADPHDDDPDYQPDLDDENDSVYSVSDGHNENETEYITDNDHQYTDDQDDSNVQFEDVQYLEVEIDKYQVAIIEEENVQTQTIYKEPEQPAQGTRKWPKKKKARRSYRNYTLENLNSSIAAVKTGLMTPAAAGLHYGVPRKTIAAKILDEKRGVVPKRTTNKQTRYHKLIEEVETLLTYTNATPFKSKTAHYHCAYCSTAGPLFEDGDELRAHTRTQHAGERTKGVEKFMRPFWLNEVLKVDIDNLHCSVCCVVLVSWNDMFRHLRERHGVALEEAYARVVPFVLGRELRCALCKDPFPNFHHLDGHMNAHYDNYMCSECGDTFLSESRLKKHEKIHNTGRFPCEECGKHFALDKYRRKHIDQVHKHEDNVKCLYCEERFAGTYPRHLHVMERHREKVNFITCELCGKIFDWRPYYLVHVRRKHEDEKKYKCNFCEGMFFMKSELTRHMVTHTGEKFACEACDKIYSTKGSLHTHMLNIHGTDMRERHQ